MCVCNAFISAKKIKYFVKQRSESTDSGHCSIQYVPSMVDQTIYNVLMIFKWDDVAARISQQLELNIEKLSNSIL